MTRSTSSLVIPSLVVNLVILLVAVVAAVLFSRTIGLAQTSEVLRQTLIAPPSWMVVATLLLVPMWYLILDGMSSMGNRLRLPFAGSQQRAKRIYAGRVHLVLLGFYFNAILVALCWSAAAMPLFSKLFLAAVFAIAIYAMGQSIPSTRLSYLVSGILFVIVLVATQAFIIFKMQAEAEATGEELRQQFEEPEEEGFR
ncbi:MAG: hypothetical protein AAFZ80_03630 [Cyanobacteria bacterium P01_A01_bin.105]